MHAPLLPFYAGAAKGCVGAGGGPPTATCRRLEIVQGAGRPQATRCPRRRARGRSPRRRCLRHRRACGPSACPLQELSEGAPAPCRSPQKWYRRRLRPAAGPKLCREPDGRRPPATGGRRARGLCPRRRCAAPPGLRPECLPLAGTSEGAPAPCRSPQKRGALRLPRKCDQILMPSSAILSRSERKSAKPFWVLAGLRSSAAGWKVPIIQTPFFSAHSPCWRVTL